MIDIQNLTKRYGPQTVVDDVTFRCEPGTVTGFLGPNGAGKTTTMRMLCGLSRPTAGSSTVLGVPYPQLRDPGRRIGVLLDAGAVHGGRTGRETLLLSAQVMGVDRRRVDELLELVGLTGRAPRKRVRQYSLGMRQRLGLAHALLGEPSVLVLDEPANGLDPEGIWWMRTLIRQFADRGGTVLLSSHLLHEVEVVADRLVVIGGGRVVASGTKDELLAPAGVVVRATEPGALGAALDAAALPWEAVDGSARVDATTEAVGWAAHRAGVVLTELRPADGGSLEQLFMSLTGSSTGSKPATSEVSR